MPGTIKLGSNGNDVKQWQGILAAEKFPVAVDGNFGKTTATATKLWQQKHQLAADGVVGARSWAAALGTTLPPAKTSAAPTDAWAHAIALKAAPSMPEVERQYALAVSRGEGFYGKGWTGEGAGSFNWGAVQGIGDAGSFGHVDHHADGKPYNGKFKRYSSPEAGFLDFAHILLKPNVKAALAKGDLHGAVFAQHSNGYFELDPEKYYQAVKGNAQTLAVNLGWRDLLNAAGVAMGASVAVAMLFVVGAGVAWLALRGHS